MAMATRRSLLGFTLIEMMVTVSVAAVVLMVTVPSFVHMFTRVRVEGTGNELSADLQYARTEAIRRRQEVYLKTNSDGSGYAIAASAATPVQLKGVVFSNGVRVTEGEVEVLYDAMRAMVQTERTVTLSDSANRAQLRIFVNKMGRVEMCSPGGSISSYPACAS